MAHDDKREVVDVGADWSKIKTEYITTDTSYRKLAQKYGVSTTQICNVGREEGWVQLREQHLNKTVAKSVAAAERRKVAQAERMQNVADRLLDKLEKAVEELDLDVITVREKFVTDSGERTEESLFTREGGIVDRDGLRKVTAAMRDLKEVLQIRTKLDEQEQEARIDKLREEAQKKDDNREITVVISEEAEDYCG